MSEENQRQKQQVLKLVQPHDPSVQAHQDSEVLVNDSEPTGYGKDLTYYSR